MVRLLALLGSVLLSAAAGAVVIWQIDRLDVETAPAPPTTVAEQTRAPSSMLDDSNELLTAAAEFAHALLSVSASTADVDVERVLDGSTGAFHDDFEERLPELLEALESTGSDTTTSVSAVAVESRTDGSAVVLVASTSTATVDGVEQAPRPSRIRLVMEDVDGRYLAAAVELVP